MLCASTCVKPAPGRCSVHLHLLHVCHVMYMSCTLCVGLHTRTQRLTACIQIKKTLLLLLLCHFGAHVRGFHIYIVLYGWYLHLASCMVPWRVRYFVQVDLRDYEYEYMYPGRSTHYYWPRPSTTAAALVPPCPAALIPDPNSGGGGGLHTWLVYC